MVIEEDNPLLFPFQFLKDIFAANLDQIFILKLFSEKKTSVFPFLVIWFWKRNILEKDIQN